MACRYQYCISLFTITETCAYSAWFLRVIAVKSCCVQHNAAVLGVTSSKL